jgi:predicted outer membrane repeat protein
LYVSNALVNVLESSFIDNNGGHGGGAIASAGVVTITNSTFVGNQALSWGGKGGAINNVSNLAIINSTFSENASEVGGGISNYRGNVHITNSTFAGNSATSFGGGINNFDIGSIYLSNTIIANHISGGDCSGDMVDNGNNLDSDGICGLDPNKGSLPNTDPALGPLQDNGGLTWTHALLRFSPAIDAGGEAVCPPADQRGVLRPIDGDGDGLQMCDMGAYEADVPPAEEIYLPLLCRF